MHGPQGSLPSSHAKLSALNYSTYRLLPVNSSAVFDGVPLETRPADDVDSSSAGARNAENLGERSFGRFEVRALILFDFVDSALRGSCALLRDVRPGSSAGRSPGSSHLLNGRAPSSCGPGPFNGSAESNLSSRYVGEVGDPTSTSVEGVPIDQMCCWAWEGEAMASLSPSYKERAVRSW